MLIAIINIIIYFQIDAIVKYNNKIFNDEYELKKFLKYIKNILKKL